MKGIIGDSISKHVTDGHIIHHFFATQIPHYHLVEATRVLYTVLKEKNINFSAPLTTNPLFNYYKMLFSFKFFTTPTNNKSILCLTKTKWDPSVNQPIEEMEPCKDEKNKND